MRKPIIIGNWKMNKTNAEAEEFIRCIERELDNNTDFGIAAPFTALAVSVKTADKLIVAGQNCHYEDTGAFTGEISVAMLAELGVKWCIIGHSERRQYYQETDESVNKKAKKLISSGFTPIICVGETLAQFEAGATEAVVRSQLAACLDGLTAEAVAGLVIAYEPVWAIGTGRNATKEIAQATCAICRDEIKKLFGDDAAAAVRIQYGGSVKPDNIAEYMAEEDIDGALIGGASLKTESFKEIISALK